MAHPSPPPPQPLTFNVRQRTAELVPPAKPTPREIKLLSDIDDQEGLRSHIPLIFFYPNNPSMAGVDPAKVIREAVAKALVFYYPLAGRLREGAGRRLVVDCTGEGVLFTEADADVTLRDFDQSGALFPPYPCLDKLLRLVPPNSQQFLDLPLFFIQVTRLRCGGLILTVSINHTISDGPGLTKFLFAVAEMARGASSPSVLPIWGRELFRARDPPRVTHSHPEYDPLPESKGTQIQQSNNMIHRSFFFGPNDILTLRKSLPPHLCNRSTFEVLTAFLWRCRTMALGYHPEDEVCALIIVNGRYKFDSSIIPPGFFGNALAHIAAKTTAGELIRNPLAYAVELIMKTKEVVTLEYMQSLADFLALNGRPHYNMVRTFLVSSVNRARLSEWDFGWGKAVYGGPALGSVAGFLIPFTNNKGENGIVVPFRFPDIAMERFALEIDKLKGNESLIKSTL